MRIGGSEMPDFDFQPVWIAVLSLVPAFLNLLLFSYAVAKLPRTRLTFSFTTFVFLLALWQTLESLGRTSASIEAAEYFVHASLITLVLVPVFGIHFILRLTGLTRVKSTPAFYILYIVMPILLGLILSTHSYSYTITSSELFNWNISPDHTLPTFIYLGWIGVACLGIVVACWYAYLYSNSHSIDVRGLQLIAWGFSIPVILGVVCEILLPIFTDENSFPVANVAVLSFSFASFYVLIRTDLLRSIPKHEWKYILNHMSEGIIVLDSNLKLRYCNRKIQSILKATSGKVWEYDFNGNFKIAGIDLKNISQQNETKTEINLPTFHGNTTEIAVRMRNYVNRENNNRETLIIVSDLHRLKKAENAAVVRTNQLTSLLYRTSHDLKNPAVCIQGLLSLYKTGTREDQNKCIELIEVSNNRILTILQSMAMVTRFSQHKSKMQEVKVAELINSAETHLTSNNSSLQLINAIPQEITINTDPQLLDFVFREMIHNADKFRRPLVVDSFLKVTYAANRSAHVISFIDNGIGIPSHHSGEVFGIFFRAHEHSGTGMGLYSVKWICDKLGYQINYARTSEGHTEFTITIPREELLSDSTNPESVSETSFSEVLTA